MCIDARLQARLLRSDDYFVDDKREIFAQHFDSMFAVHSKYLLLGTGTFNNLTLHVSTNGQHFSQARFPSSVRGDRSVRKPLAA